MLNYVVHEGPLEGPTLLIAHGLYGSARNWGVVAKRLSVARRVVAVDMRNHGNSPWFTTHSYGDMAADLAEVVREIGGPVDLLGHSMGGKAAMVCALTYPQLVDRLIVADIAPVTYAHSQIQFINAMKGVDLEAVKKRSDASAMLAASVDDPALISFFTQSLDVAGRRWRLNLDVLADQMPNIMGFPDMSEIFKGPTMFLSGGESDYVNADNRDVTRALFPAARFASIKGAGHWLHAEKPREFVATVEAWLSARS